MLLKHNFTESSMLDSCEYDTDENELTVNFNNGRTYIYKDCPQSYYDGLIGAKSAGKYFNSIKQGLTIK